MIAVGSGLDAWQRQARPPALFRRFAFANYAATRAFLDRLAELSSATGRYPDLGFAATYVNVTLASEGDAIGPADEELALRIAALAVDTTA